MKRDHAQAIFLHALTGAMARPDAGVESAVLLAASAVETCCDNPGLDQIFGGSEHGSPIHFVACYACLMGLAGEDQHHDPGCRVAGEA
jgi:hypothetical protein